MLVLPRQLFTSRWPWIVCEFANAVNDALAIFLRCDAVNFFDRRRLDQDPISCHAASDLLERLRMVSWVRSRVPQRLLSLQHPQQV